MCEYDAAFTLLTVQRSVGYKVSLSLGGCSRVPFWVPPQISIHFYYVFIYSIFLMQFHDIAQTWFVVLLTFVLTHRVRISKILVQTMAE